MGETLKAIAEFLRLSKRNAFALFAAGTTLWVLLRLDVVKNDALQIGVAYLACFGLWIFLSYTIEARIRVARSARRQLEATEQRARAAEVASAEAEQQAAADKTLALNNMRHLGEHESNAMIWIHNRGAKRIRASQHFSEIAGLVRLKILIVEDPDLPFNDRMFTVPDHVRAFLAELFGKPKPKEASDKPPWEGRGRF
jgi:PAS domain-containing protein